MAGPSPEAGAPTPAAKPVPVADTGKASSSSSSTPHATPAPAPAPAAATTTACSSTTGPPSVYLGATRAPYVPQFSAATQMILKRMRGETGSLSSALASATAPGVPRPKFSQSTYDSVRERIVANMGNNNNNNNNNNNSSSSSSSSSSSNTGAGAGAAPKKKPAATGTPPSSSSPSMTSTTTLRLPVSSSSPKPARLGTPTSAAAAAANKDAGKRKRKRDSRDDASDVSSIAEASDYGEGIKKVAPRKKTAAGPTMTKSGRQVLKPDTYDPAAEDNAKKRNQLGKRTTEQALCKKCQRMHSPATNQMVFCDGCNDPWHQRCHEPWIEDEVIRDQSVNWYCSVCQAKRERSQPKKKVAVVERPKLGSWAGKTVGQKRTYLSSLPQADLVNLLLHAIEIHPNLPIFPVNPSSATSTPKKGASASAPSSSFASASAAGLFSRAEANPTGPMNFIRKIPANAKKSTMAKARSGPGTLQSKAAAQASSGHQVYDEEDASFTKLWPRPNKGMYSRLPPEADDDRVLVDGNDYASFSAIVFNEKGKKVEENGVKV